MSGVDQQNIRRAGRTGVFHDMDTKKVVSGLAIVFVFFFILQNPDDAANIAHSLGHGLRHAYDQLSEFFKQL